jgi:hypothetical protein
MKLSRPKPIEETEPAINPRDDDGDETFDAVVGDGEIFESLALANENGSCRGGGRVHPFQRSLK